MPLTINELEQGIAFWQTETNWPHDFHNADYEMMAHQNPNGAFDEHWWVTFLHTLVQWQATRPRSNEFLTHRAHDRLQALGAIWHQTVALNLDNDIADLEWQQIAAFPTLVAEIKNVASPVFPSKFCHFLAPCIFPVVDNKAMGNPFRTYELYYISGRAEWLGTAAATQEDLTALLIHEIGVPLIANYPMKCKLIELCMIGRRNNG